MEFPLREVLGSPTGASLNLFSHVPQSPRAVVQINHGLAEHAARYARFAAALFERGYGAYAHDHRGHGATTAPDTPLGSFGPGGGEAVIADVAAVHDMIAARHPGVPVVIFGHSMGGLITLNALMSNSARVAGAAIWNSNFSAGAAGRVAQAVLAWEKFRMGSDVPSRVLPAMTFDAWGRKIPNHRTKFDWLSRDPVEVDKYVADPLCGWQAAVGMWQAIFGFVFAGADDDNLRKIRRDLPLNLVGGEMDPATNGGKAVTTLAKRMGANGFSNLKSTIWPQTRHESLNDLNRDIITTDFIDWLDASLSR